MMTHTSAMLSIEKRIRASKKRGSNNIMLQGSINEIEFELSRKRMLVIITMMSSLFYFSVLFNRELCSQTQEEINRWRASEHLQGLNVYS